MGFQGLKKRFLSEKMFGKSRLNRERRLEKCKSFLLLLPKQINLGNDNERKQHQISVKTNNIASTVIPCSNKQGFINRNKLTTRLRSRTKVVYDQTQSSANPCVPRPDQRSIWSEKSGAWSGAGLIRGQFGLKSLDHGLEMV